MYKKAMVIGRGRCRNPGGIGPCRYGRGTYLVESGPSIGGRMSQLDKTFPTNDLRDVHTFAETRAGRLASLYPYYHHGEVISIKGKAPELTVKVLKRPRYVNESACTDAHLCDEMPDKKFPIRTIRD